MYEARQCKEKVSRRIDATGGGTSQKKHINYDWQSILNGGCLTLKNFLVNLQEVEG